MSARLFVDCGGHDGCSVIKFLSRHPGYAAITFEPNPALWHYYRFLPTRLIRKAVATHDGAARLTIDPINGDGSSIVPEKDVAWDGSLSNAQCPVMQVPCVDLSAFLRANVRPGDHLCLKLDVEGAEYAILEKMLAEGTIDLVEELLVEFHWQRCGIPEARHRALRAALERRTRVEEWDAVRYSVLRRRLRRGFRRVLQLVLLWPRHVAARALGRA